MNVREQKTTEQWGLFPRWFVKVWQLVQVPSAIMGLVSMSDGWIKWVEWFSHLITFWRRITGPLYDRFRELIADFPLKFDDWQLDYIVVGMILFAVPLTRESARTLFRQFGELRDALGKDAGFIPTSKSRKYTTVFLIALFIGFGFVIFLIWILGSILLWPLSLLVVVLRRHPKPSFPKLEERTRGAVGSYEARMSSYRIKRSAITTGGCFVFLVVFNYIVLQFFGKI